MRRLAAAIALTLTIARVAHAQAPPAQAIFPPPPTRAVVSPEPDDGPERFETMLVWGLTTLELAIAASVTWLIAGEVETGSTGEYALLLSPFPLAVAVSVPAYLGRWPREIPLAIHGAAWTALHGILLGSMIEAALDDGNATLETGPALWLFGGLGAIAGAWIGALEVSQRELVGFYVPPPASLMADIVVLGIVAIINFLSGDDGKTFETAAVWSTLAVSTIGLGISYAFAFSE